MVNEGLIRKMVCADIPPVKKLPVQLAQPVPQTLYPRKMRALLYDPFYLLLVYQYGQQISAFAGLKYGTYFITVDWLAADRFEAAAWLEAHAVELAKEKERLAVVVSCERLAAGAKDFYKERGYVHGGNKMIKPLWNIGY